MTLKPLDQTFYRALHDRLRTEMVRSGSDGCLALQSGNVIYLSGFFHSVNERPVGLFIPVDGDPVLFVPLLERENAEGGFIKDIRTYPEFPGVENPVEWMVRETGARRLSVDSLSARDHQGVLPLVSALHLTTAITGLRNVKQPEELAFIRAAAGFADLCLETIHANLVDMAKSGASESAILSLGMTTALSALNSAHGKDLGGTKLGITGSLHSGPRAALPHGKTSARVPALGDTVISGIGASVGGYHAESGVTWTVGEASEDQLRCLRAAKAANDAGIAALRPGVRCDSVNTTALHQIEVQGLSEHIRHRIGHGMGIEGHEAPWLSPGDGTLVEAGMVFSNEPGIYRPGIDGYRTINTMIVTSDGVEVPSRFQARHDLSSRQLAW